MLGPSPESRIGILYVRERVLKRQVREEDPTEVREGDLYEVSRELQFFREVSASGWRRVPDGGWGRVPDGGWGRVPDIRWGSWRLVKVRLVFKHNIGTTTGP